MVSKLMRRAKIEADLAGLNTRLMVYVESNVAIGHTWREERERDAKMQNVSPTPEPDRKSGILNSCASHFSRKKLPRRPRLPEGKI